MNRCILRNSGKLSSSQLYSKRFVSKSHYEVLGVTEDATLKDIKHKYIQKCKELHPDANPGINTHRQFVQLQNSYTILSNKKSRDEYDKELLERLRRNQSRQAESYRTETKRYNDKRSRTHDNIFNKWWLNEDELKNPNLNNKTFIDWFIYQFLKSDDEKIRNKRSESYQNRYYKTEDHGTFDKSSHAKERPIAAEKYKWVLYTAVLVQCLFMCIVSKHEGDKQYQKYKLKLMNSFNDIFKP